MSKSAKVSEQRAEERYGCVGTVVLVAPIEGDEGPVGAEDFHSALLQDMSLSGLAFEVSVPMPVGAHVEVLVRPAHGGGQEHLMAEVRWCKQSAPARYRIGVRIEWSEFVASDAPAVDAEGTDNIVGVLTSYRQALAEEEAPGKE